MDAGQFPSAQLSIHHWSIFLSPFHCPIAWHLPWNKLIWFKLNLSEKFIREFMNPKSGIWSINWSAEKFPSLWYYCWVICAQIDFSLAKYFSTRRNITSMIFIMEPSHSMNDSNWIVLKFIREFMNPKSWIR